MDSNLFSPPLPFHSPPMDQHLHFPPPHPRQPPPPPQQLPENFLGHDLHINAPLRSDHPSSFPWFSPDYLEFSSPSRQFGISSLQENAWLMEGAAALSMASSFYFHKIYSHGESRVEILPRIVYSAYYIYHTFFSLQSMTKFSPIEIALASFFTCLKLYQSEIHPKPATILAGYLRRSKFRLLPQIQHSTALFQQNIPQSNSKVTSLSAKFSTLYGPDQWNMLIDLVSEADMKYYIEKTTQLTHELQQFTSKTYISTGEALPRSISSKITPSLTNSIFAFMCQRMLYLEAIICEVIQYQFNIPFLSKDLGQLIGSIYLQAGLPIPFVPNSNSTSFIITEESNTQSQPQPQPPQPDPITALLLIERSHQMLEVICAYTRWLMVYPPHQLTVLAVLCAIESLRQDFQTAHPDVILPPLCPNPQQYTIQSIPQTIAPQYVSTPQYPATQVPDIMTLEKLYQTGWFRPHILLQQSISPTISSFNLTREISTSISTTLTTAADKLRRFVDVSVFSGKINKSMLFVATKDEDDDQHDRLLEDFQQLALEARTQPTMVYTRLFMQTSQSAPSKSDSDGSAPSKKPDPFHRDPSAASYLNLIEANKFCIEIKKNGLSSNLPLIQQSIPLCSCQQPISPNIQQPLPPSTSQQQQLDQQDQQHDQYPQQQQQQHELQHQEQYHQQQHQQHQQHQQQQQQQHQNLQPHHQQQQDNNNHSNFQVPPPPPPPLDMLFGLNSTGNTGSMDTNTSTRSDNTQDDQQKQRQELQMGTPLPLIYDGDGETSP